MTEEIHATPPQILLSSLLSHSHSANPKYLAFVDIDASTDPERRLAKTIIDALKRRRVKLEADNLKRGKRDPVALTMLKANTWDELVDISLVREIAAESETTPVLVLDFMVRRCSPKNWRALFWMSAWFELLSDRTAEFATQIDDAVRSVKVTYEKQLADAAKRQVAPAAEARRKKARDDLAALAIAAQPYRGKKSKEQAANALGDTGKYGSSATIRGKLTKLFPSTSWSEK